MKLSWLSSSFPSSIYYHGTYVRWLLRCAREDHSMLFDLCKAFDWTESSHESDFFSIRKGIFAFMRAERVQSYHLI